MSCSTEADDSDRLHSRYGPHCGIIQVTLPTCWCSCIWIVRKITVATSFAWKGPPRSTNYIFKCVLSIKIRPSSSRKWWEQCFWMHFSHRKSAQLESWLVKSESQRWQMRGRYWMLFWPRQLIRRFRKPRPERSACHSESSRIDSTNSEVQERVWIRVRDGQCNGNEDDKWNTAMDDRTRRYDSTGSLSGLTVCLILRYIMGAWWAATCEYRLMNSCIVGAPSHSAWYIHFNTIRTNSSRLLEGLALPPGWVSILQESNQQVQMITNTIIGGSRC